MKQQTAWRTPQKLRDRLLSAAMKLAEDPTKTLDFLAVADAVITELQERPDHAARS